MIIAGAGGHAREIYMLLEKEATGTVSFFDDLNPAVPEKIANAKVLRSIGEAREEMKKDPRFIIGTGNPAARRKLYNLFLHWGGCPFTFRCATALVSSFETTIGEGANIMHDTFVSSNVTIGKGCLVNTRAQVHHDVTMGEFCEIGPAAVILGNVQIGNDVLIGAGAILLPGIQVAHGATIGAGAVVTKNILTGRVVKGNPAR